MPTDIANSNSKTKQSALTLKPSFYQNLVDSSFIDSTPEDRGAYFTRNEVVDFILDIAGFTSEKKLFETKLLEPSFGNGSFIINAIRRLIRSWRTYTVDLSKPDIDLAHCIKAVELHQETFNVTKRKILDVLISEGITKNKSEALLQNWLHCGDFLLIDLDNKFDFVVGNPPYVRQELIPDSLLQQYRNLYHTMYDRADLYIPFIERSLSLLKANSNLGFICSNRWMKNKYGGPLRNLIAEKYHLKYCVDMVDTKAFEQEVSAYPAIFVISTNAGLKTKIAHVPALDNQILTEITRSLIDTSNSNKSTKIVELDRILFKDEPWILESSDQINLVKRLESQFPLLEEVGCKVGIGVATGADKIFIAPFDKLDIEDDRKLPLLSTNDIKSGQVVWKGNGVVNPFEDDGTLVTLNDYPKLQFYLNSNAKVLKNRHVAKKNPDNWYRTIDRINPSVMRQPKLLIPDIKGTANIVYDEGNYYPHHNLYYITSNDWDLHALQCVLASGIARLFVSVYSTKMRGGYLRFQAQYLRRIRIPKWKDIPILLRQELQLATQSKNRSSASDVVYKIYGLTKIEKEAIGGNSELSWQ